MKSPAIPGEAPPWKSDFPSELSAFIVRPAIFSTFTGLTCGLSTRRGGVSPEPYGMNTSFSVGDATEFVTENRNRLFAALGVSPDRLAIPQQRHTAVVKNVTEGGTYEECDALVTDEPNVFLSVSVADCAPVFLFDKSNGVLACVHAGWRGTAQQILRNSVVRMQQEFGSKAVEIVAFIGPSAGQCCYEVGEEVAKQFDANFVHRRSGSIYLDIKKANVDQLRRAGVPASNIEVHRDCTICNPEVYHSYRRERQNSGRMMGVIGMRQ